MSWLKKLIPSKITTASKKAAVPEGLWSKCPSCSAVLYRQELERNLFVCTKCGYHNRLTARQRLNIFLDKENRKEISEDLEPVDWLKFKDSKRYKERLSQATKATSEKEALVVMQGELKTVPVVALAFEFNFIGGSMGSVVGEKFTRGVRAAIANNCPLISFAASGGARMQEGLFSLMQMAKTSAALTLLAEKNLPFISVMLDPMMGGVSASFASLGDINIAEPNALIGFAGPRVIEQTVRETLPEGFQRAEFLEEHGFVDMIVERKKMRDTIHRLIKKMI